MTYSQDSSQLSVTSESLEILQQSVGRTLNEEEIKNILKGNFYFPPISCIRALSYGQDNQLETVAIGRVILTKFEIKDDPNAVINLNDFQERLQEAAKFGYSVSVLINRETRKIVRISLFPCDCQCNQEVTDNIELLASKQGGCFRWDGVRLISIPCRF